MPLSSPTLIQRPGRFLIQDTAIVLADIQLLPGAAYIVLWNFDDNLFFRLDADAEIPVAGVISNDLITVSGAGNRVDIFVGNASRLSMMPENPVSSVLYMQEFLFV